MPNSVSNPRIASSTMLALASALLLASCGGNSDGTGASQSSPDSQAASGEPVTDSVQVDAAIEKTPCELASAEMVATLFSVPVAELERESSMSSACVYSWENSDETERLDAKVKVSDVYEDAEQAALRFRAVTKGMSGADLDHIKAGIKEKAAAELNSRGEKAAGAIMGKTTGSRGIQFEDVEGVGDEARFALTVGAGDLHVRVGNLYFTTSAYSGATMPMPEKMTGASILASNKKWRQDTMPQRKDAAIKLARAVVDSL